MNNPLSEMEFEIKYPKDHVLGEIIRASPFVVLIELQ